MRRKERPNSREEDSREDDSREEDLSEGDQDLDLDLETVADPIRCHRHRYERADRTHGGATTRSTLGPDQDVAPYGPLPPQE
jgi:hypothetical protein